MALGNPSGDLSGKFNSVYNIPLDLSGWDKTTIQVVAPIGGVLYVYATNDPNALQGVRDGNATLATNYNPVQVTNLATGTAVTSISAAGLYKYDVNAQFLKIQGNPASAGTNVYRLLLFNSKIS